MPNLSANGLFEPSLTHVFLPRCRDCGNKHPLAYRPPLRADKCPACGARQVSGRAVSVPAVLTGHGPSASLARACFAVARWARRRLERMP